MPGSGVPALAFVRASWSAAGERGRSCRLARWLLCRVPRSGVSVTPSRARLRVGHGVAAISVPSPPARSVLSLRRTEPAALGDDCASRAAGLSRWGCRCRAAGRCGRAWLGSLRSVRAVWLHGLTGPEPVKVAMCWTFVQTLLSSLYNVDRRTYVRIPAACAPACACGAVAAACGGGSHSPSFRPTHSHY